MISYHNYYAVYMNGGFPAALIFSSFALRAVPDIMLHTVFPAVYRQGPALQAYVEDAMTV